MRFFPFLTLLIIVESVNSHSSNFHFHARRSTGIIKRQLLGLGEDPPSSSDGGLLGGLLGGHPSPSPSPTAAAPAASTPATTPSSSDALGGAVGGLLSPLAPATSALAPVLKPVESAAAPVLQPVVSAADPVLSPIASAAAPIVKPIASAAAPVVKPIASVVSPVASAAAPVASIAASAVAPVITIASSAAGPVVSIATSVAGPVVSKATSIAGPVVSIATSVAGPVVSIGTSVAGPVVSIATSVAGPVVSKATSIAGPVVSIATSVAGPVTSALPPVASLLPPITSALPPITSALPPVASLLPPVTSVLPPITSVLPPVASLLPPITSALPPFTSVLPPVASVLPPVTSLLPPVTSPFLPFTSLLPPIISPFPPDTSAVPQFTSAVPQFTSPIVPSAVSPFASSISIADVPLPNSVTPTVTLPPPETPTNIPSSSAVSLIPIISFPKPSITTVPTLTTNAPLAKSATMSIDSKISFILTISSLALNSMHSTPANSLTNPDQASSTALPASAVPTTSLPLPSGMPARIYPPDLLDPNTDLTGYTFIAILFDLELNWPFVVTSPISSTQIFAYIPIIIATALGIEGSQILTWALQVYIPTSYHSPADADQLGTLWLGYVPSNVVTTLAQEILAKQSKFYTGESDTVARALAQHVNSGFDILSVSDPNPSGPSSGDGGKSRRDTIIGVVTSLGGIAFFVLVFLAYRIMKNRRDHAHRRLSDPSNLDSPGIRPEGQDFDQDSVGGARRRSFYYAEDSLRGFQDPEQERVTGPSVMTERRTVVPGTPISPPVLQQSSLNW